MIKLKKYLDNLKTYELIYNDEDVIVDGYKIDEEQRRVHIYGRGWKTGKRYEIVCDLVPSVGQLEYDLEEIDVSIDE